MDLHISRGLFRAALVLGVTAFALLALIFIETDSTSAQKLSQTKRLADVMVKDPEIGAVMAGTITGRVFQDFNGNGMYDTSGGTTAAPTAVDSGIAGVNVSAYTSIGALAGSTTTIGDGTFSLAASGTGPYRVEFTSLPAGFTPSARSTDSAFGGNSTNSGSTVQFVADGNTANLNLALNRAQDYCSNNPELCSQLYGVGDATQPEAVFTIPYTAGSIRTSGGTPVTDFQSPGNTSLATTDQVGTTFGIAYHRQSRRIFVSSYMKKHAKFGPGGPGAIYQIDRNSGVVSQYVNFDTVFGAGTAGTNPHNTADYNTDNGNTTWNAVGKIAFGGMAISDDQAYLYVMNLADRRLYRIPTSGTLNSTTITSVAFPTTTVPNCTASSEVRPFAVNIYEGTIYVGAVCSRETSSGTQSTNLRAYVYTFDPTTMAFGSSPVMNFQLNYSRTETDPGYPAAWLNWRATYSTISSSHFIYPQPMLTDIEFDRGNMILSLRDRNGDQSGYNSASNPGNSGQLFKGITAGDILRACGNPTSGWTLESNGRCGSIGSAPQNTGEGPGNGEYYFQDSYRPNGNPHDEIGVGAAMQIPGHNVMVASVFDPAYIPNNSVFDAGGFRWFNNSTGEQNRGYLAYWLADFGKANGIGNIQALCEAAPIEIGNRVWFDVNNNGVQDPGEAPLAGVTVRLFQGATVVGSAVTDANGEYYFVGSTSADPNILDNIGQVNGGVQAATSYQIRLDNLTDYTVVGPLSGLALTTANQTAQLGNDDGSDSDAAFVTNPAGSPTGSFPVVSITTGNSGANDHTFDIGLFAAPSAAPVTVGGRVRTALGAGIRGAIVRLTESDGTVHTATTGTFGTFWFKGIPSGQIVLIDVSSRRFSFTVPTQAISIEDNVSGFDFVSDQW